jgi:hypothetical protein
VGRDRGTVLYDSALFDSGIKQAYARNFDKMEEEQGKGNEYGVRDREGVREGVNGHWVWESESLKGDAERERKSSGLQGGEVEERGILTPDSMDFATQGFTLDDYDREREIEREKAKERERDREREREKEKEMVNEREREREIVWEREKEKERERVIEWERGREMEREKQRDREIEKQVERVSEREMKTFNQTEAQKVTTSITTNMDKINLDDDHRTEVERNKNKNENKDGSQDDSDMAEKEIALCSVGVGRLYAGARPWEKYTRKDLSAVVGFGVGGDDNTDNRSGIEGTICRTTDYDKDSSKGRGRGNGLWTIPPRIQSILQNTSLLRSDAVGSSVEVGTAGGLDAVVPYSSSGVERRGSVGGDDDYGDRHSDTPGQETGQEQEQGQGTAESKRRTSYLFPPPSHTHNPRVETSLRVGRGPEGGSVSPSRSRSTSRSWTLSSKRDRGCHSADKKRGSGLGLGCEREVGVGVTDGVRTGGNGRERDDRRSRSSSVRTEEGEYVTSRRGTAGSARTPYARRGSTGGMHSTAGTFQDSLPALTYPLGVRDRDGGRVRESETERERDIVESKGGKVGVKVGQKEVEEEKAMAEDAEIKAMLEAVKGSSSGRERERESKEDTRGVNRGGTSMSYSANFTRRNAVTAKISNNTNISSSSNTNISSSSSRTSTPLRSVPRAAPPSPSPALTAADGRKMTSSLSTLKDSITANYGVRGKTKSGTASREARKRTDDWLPVSTNTPGTVMGTDVSADLPRVTDVQVEAVKGWLWTLGLCVLDGEGGHYTLPLSAPQFPSGAYV